MKSKIFFTLIAMVLMGVTGWLGYLTYHEFDDYRSAQTSSRSLHEMRDLKQMSAALRHEQTLSGVYRGKDGKQFAQALHRARAESDRALERLLSTVQHEGTQYAQMLAPLKKSLTYVRSTVDALSGQYANTIGRSFDGEMYPALLAAMGRYSRSFHTASLRDESQAVTSLFRSALALNGEGSFLGYLVGRTHHPLSADDVRDWDRLMQKEFTPDLTHIPDLKLLNTLKTLHANIQKKDAVGRIRGLIIEHANDGAFPIKVTEVTKTFDRHTGLESQAIEMIMRDMVSRANTLLTSTQTRLIQYGVGLVMTLLGLLLLLRVTSTSYRERRALEKTLEEMVTDFPPEQQAELQTILKKSDTLAIYRFLADTTREAHEARAQAIEAEKAKDLFLANMSHEIRTPLNGILGFTQLLEMSDLDEEQQSHVNIIQSSSNNLLTIVNSILDLSKIRANKVELEAIPFNPVDVFGDAIEPLEVLASDKKIRYCSFIDPRLHALIGDPTRLRQVLTNLIGNAMKFTRSGGEVRVVIEQIDEKGDDQVHVRFSVTDTGIGITPEQKQKIFDAFSQADSSTTREFGGTGLGLAITSDIVKQMGGTLDVESELDKGSEFFFVLPLKKVPGHEPFTPPYPEKKIAYYCSKESSDGTCGLWTMRYLETLTPHATQIGALTHDVAKKFDIIFLDYSLAEVRNRIQEIFTFDTKIVLLGYHSYKSEIDTLIRDNVAIIYRPLMYGKMLQAMGRFYGDTGRTEDAQSDREENSLTGLRILVAEDNTINQNLILAVLNNLDVDVTMVENGKRALEMRQKEDYDLIFMDIQMPVMGGIDATKAILEYEEREGGTHVPIIALTANALQGDREKYMRVGMDDYVSKPIVLDEIRTVIENHCQIETRPMGAEVTSVPSPTTHADTTASTPVVADEAVSDPAHLHPDTPSPEVTVVEEGDVLLYCRSRLIQSIHTRALEPQGYAVDVVEDEGEFFDAFESKVYRYVLLDAQLIPTDNCSLTHAIEESGAVPLVYALAKEHTCYGHVGSYAKIEELKAILTP